MARGREGEDNLRPYSGFRPLTPALSPPRAGEMNFILVGVGDGVDEEQTEDTCHAEYPGVGHLWCHRVADRMEEMADLVAVLVDETMTVAGGGTIDDDKGNTLKADEARLPAVLEFRAPAGCRSFTLEVAGQRYTQPLSEDDEEHGGEEDHAAEERDHSLPPFARVVSPPPAPETHRGRHSGKRHRGHH